MKFIDVLENISDFLNDDLGYMRLLSAYADKGYDAALNQKLFEMLWN